MAIKELLEYIAKNLVEHPEQVAVEAGEKEDGEILLTLRVARSDMGKVIGRQGRVIGEIRTLLRAAAGREQKKVSVEVAD